MAKICTVKDPIHDGTPTTLNKFFFLPDVILLLNASVVITGITLSDTPKLHQPPAFFIIVLLIYFIIMRVRRMLNRKMDCNIRDTHASRHDKTWHIITGHLLTSALLTFSFWHGTNAAPVFKRISLILTLLMGPVSALTREHFTIDVIVTWGILLALYWLYKSVLAPRL